ncbi:MAG: serine hydrolase domain-containing protein [Verrucomicrobiota bacterium]
MFNPTTILQKNIEQLECPGALLAVSENGDITTYSAGSIGKDGHNRSFYIYSISKTLTATAILLLCEEQGNFLDEPLAVFLSEAPIPRQITIRQLLNHTSGLSDYFSSAEYRQALSDNPTTPWTYDKLMMLGLRDTPLFEPGTSWSYSNPGYALLEELIEKKAEMKYYDFVRKTIIDHVALDDTRPFLEVDHRQELLEGEDLSFIGDFRTLYHPGWIAPACFISTVSDVAKFYDALFDYRIVSQDSLSEMTRTVDVLKSPTSESIPSYGLGLMHGRNSPLGDAYGHGGGGPGYTTFALHYPKLEGNSVSFSLVLNKNLPQTPFKLMDQIVALYRDSKT